jgi:hypothetical protein
MDKRAKVAELLRNLGKRQGDVFFYAVVKNITGDTCTITVNDLDLTDVRLKATDNGNADKLLITPALGSIVIVGANNGSLTDLFIVKVDDPEVITWKHGDMDVEIDSQAGTVSVKNGQVSLVDLFNSLHDIIIQLTVSTPAGPSGTPLPPTLQALSQFKTDLSNLLK